MFKLYFQEFNIMAVEREERINVAGVVFVEPKLLMFRLYFQEFDIMAVGTSDISIRSFRSTLTWDPNILWTLQLHAVWVLYLSFFLHCALSPIRWVHDHGCSNALAKYNFVATQALESHTVWLVDRRGKAKTHSKDRRGKGKTHTQVQRSDFRDSAKVNRLRQIGVEMV